MSSRQSSGDRTVLLVRAPENYVEERRYVLDVVLCDWIGLEYVLEFSDGPRVAIRVAHDPQGSELTLPDVLFATPHEDWLTERSMPGIPLAHLDLGRCPPTQPEGPNWTATDGSATRTLPILFSEPNPSGNAGTRTASGLALTLDVFGSVFFALARYEEVVRRTRDEHDRFPARASLAAAEGFLDRPIVDEYVDLLWNAIHTLWPAVVRRPSIFRLRLTHDVDQPWAALGQRALIVARATAGDLVRRRDPELAALRARSFLDARLGRVDRDPLNTFDLLMETSERHSLRSTFYFMAGNASDPFDSPYRLSDPPIARLLRRIHDRGHEVGLHAGYGSYLSAERIRAEFDTLRAACRAVGFDQPTWGVRQHFLRFENPETWRSQEAAGLDHDSTLGFADHVGFRAGTCREYPAFDLLGRRKLKLREHPLLVMDTTFFAYMALDLDEAAARTRALVDLCRRHSGDAVLLIHNSSLAGARRRAQYRDLVATLASVGQERPPEPPVNAP
jgi:uncharacterized protein DUF7033